MPTTSPWELLYFFVVLVGVVLLAYFVSKWLSKRSSLNQVQSTKFLKVVDRIVLGQDRALYVVKVGEKSMLLGVTASSIEKICDIANEDMPVISDDKPPSFADAFKTTLKNNWGINISNKSPDGEDKKNIDEK